MSDLRGRLRAASGVNKDEAGAANALAGTQGLEVLGALNAAAGTRGLGLNAVVRLLTGKPGEAVGALAGYTGGEPVTPPPPPPPPPVEPTAVEDRASLPLLLGMRMAG